MDSVCGSGKRPGRIICQFDKASLQTVPESQKVSVGCQGSLFLHRARNFLQTGNVQPTRSLRESLSPHITLEQPDQGGQYVSEQELCEASNCCVPHTSVLRHSRQCVLLGCFPCPRPLNWKKNTNLSELQQTRSIKLRKSFTMAKGWCQAVGSFAASFLNVDAP
eukprot:1146926-Pelagomonas_calceolata.AAC.6